MCEKCFDEWVLLLEIIHVVHLPQKEYEDHLEHEERSRRILQVGLAEMIQNTSTMELHYLFSFSGSMSVIISYDLECLNWALYLIFYILIM